MYLHSIPTAGNDLVLVALLAAVGLALGVFRGFATHVRAGADGVALARVGWIAGVLLVAGIGSRMAFAFAIGHGAEPAVRSFSIAHQIGAAAWPVALVSMAPDRGRRPDRDRPASRPPPALASLRPRDALHDAARSGPFRRAGRRSIVSAWARAESPRGSRTRTPAPRAASPPARHAAAARAGR